MWEISGLKSSNKSNITSSRYKKISVWKGNLEIIGKVTFKYLLISKIYISLSSHATCALIWNQRKTRGISGNGEGDKSAIYPSTYRLIDKIITRLRGRMKTGSQERMHACKYIFKAEG